MSESYLQFLESQTGKALPQELKGAFLEKTETNDQNAFFFQNAQSRANWSPDAEWLSGTDGALRTEIVKGVVAIKRQHQDSLARNERAAKFITKPTVLAAWLDVLAKNPHFQVVGIDAESRLLYFANRRPIVMSCKMPKANVDFDVNLGTFLFQLNYSFLQDRLMCGIKGEMQHLLDALVVNPFLGYRCQRADENGFFHPFIHPQTGICYGNEKLHAAQFMFDENWEAFLGCLFQILTVYQPKNPYRGLHDIKDDPFRDYSRAAIERLRECQYDASFLDQIRKWAHVGPGGLVLVESPFAGHLRTGGKFMVYAKNGVFFVIERLEGKHHYQVHSVERKQVPLGDADQGTDFTRFFLGDGEDGNNLLREKWRDIFTDWTPEYHLPDTGQGRHMDIIPRTMGPFTVWPDGFMEVTDGGPVPDTRVKFRPQAGAEWILDKLGEGREVRTFGKIHLRSDGQTLAPGEDPGYRLTSLGFFVYETPGILPDGKPAQVGKVYEFVWHRHYQNVYARFRTPTSDDVINVIRDFNRWDELPQKKFGHPVAAIMDEVADNVKLINVKLINGVLGELRTAREAKYERIATAITTGPTF